MLMNIHHFSYISYLSDELMNVYYVSYMLMNMYYVSYMQKKIFTLATYSTLATSF